jgi:hypothetical protein
MSIGGNVTSGPFVADIENGHGHIGTSATVDFHAAGSLNATGVDFLDIYNKSGTIGSDATLNVSANDLSVGELQTIIWNNAGIINGVAAVDGQISGDVVATGDIFFDIQNNDEGSGPGTIGSDATVNVTADNISTGGTLTADILNYTGGTIGGDAAVNISAGSIPTVGSLFADIFNYNSGHIVGSANINFNLTGDLTTAGDATLFITNNPAGTIGSDAMINVTANNITANSLFAQIDNRNGGSIGEGANVTLNVGGNLTTQGDATFQILNYDDGPGPGTIGSNATVSLIAANISTGLDFVANISNYNSGHIGGNADLNFNLTGDLNAQGDAFFEIFNQDDSLFGGTITGHATVNVTAANITANNLTAQIDNDDGTIGGNATINMNVSNTATITNDATFQIRGSDFAAAAAINFNGGSYGVGGEFFSRIDGNGTITFNNASAHADVLKAGVFGANGALNIINGGMLSANTTLKLYAPGSNGQLNFMSNVTLGGNSLKILAANAITIFDNVVVTIGGPNPAHVYVNFPGGIPNANYTGFGGNGTRTGTFAGAGANNPDFLTNAPDFGPSSPASITTRPRIHPRPPSTVRTPAINVSSSDELLALLDDFTPGRAERIRTLDSRRGSHGRNASRFNDAAHLNAARRAMERRTASTPAMMRRLPQ